MRTAGTLLILLGASLVVLGVLLRLRVSLKGWGRLPGDIVIHRGNFTLYLPLATSLIASLVLSLVVLLILKLSGKK